MGAKSNDTVSGGHNFGFDNRSFSLLNLASPGLHLNQAQGMEGNHVGHIDRLG